MVGRPARWEEQGEDDRAHPPVVGAGVGDAYSDQAAKGEVWPDLLLSPQVFDGRISPERTLEGLGLRGSAEGAPASPVVEEDAGWSNEAVVSEVDQKNGTTSLPAIQESWG